MAHDSQELLAESHPTYRGYYEQPTANHTALYKITLLFPRLLVFGFHSIMRMVL